MKVGLIYPHKDFRKDVDFHPNLTPRGSSLDGNQQRSCLARSGFAI